MQRLYLVRNVYTNVNVNESDNEVTIDRKEGPAARITRSEIEQAIQKMKKHKASGISGN